MIMSAVLINGIAARSGGGKSILTNFLKILSDNSPERKYVVVVPSDFDFSTCSSANITILPESNSLTSLCRYYTTTVRKLVRKYNVSVIFNLADFIIPVTTTQIYLFDWPYAMYPESVVWQQMSMREKVFRKLKLLFIRRYIGLPAVVLAQTPVAETRLKRLFNIRRIEVVPNAVSLDNLDGGKYKNFELPSGFSKLLYLTKYYPHKNLEVFIPVAKMIRDQNLNFKIIITIDSSQGPQAARLIDEIKRQKLDDVIINLGAVDMQHVPSLYQQCDALLMPSLLESFSGTYVEAMYHGKPVFSSDCDFARTVCGEAAFYFDPLSPESIINSLREAFIHSATIQEKIKAGQERLKTFPTWQEAFERYQSLIESYA
jgi:glycosyltransferase involved in cell wall biosynthesis